MANCSGNNTLDPFQNMIDAVNRGTKTLENQADFLLPLIDTFDSISASISTPSPTSLINNALNNFTADAICAASTDLAPINDFVEDCLTEAMSAVKKYLRNIMSNIEAGISLIDDFLSLPELGLFTYYQKIAGLADNIKDLIRALDNKIQCVTDESYQDQIDDINIRINDVVDSLRLAPDGSFDADTFTAGMDSDLADNVKSYDTRSKELEQEIEDGVNSTVDLSAQKTPKKHY